MTDALRTQEKTTEAVSHEGGRLVDGTSGQFGVSDKRRAELEQMEQDAGVQHEAADQIRPLRPVERNPKTALERDAEFASQPGAARPGDAH